MQLIDTHAHVYASDFGDDIAGYIERAKLAGVTHICVPNVDGESIDDVHTAAQLFPGYCLPMMGLHPTSVKADYEQQLLRIEHQFSAQRYIAVGEIGVDLYWDTTFLSEQQDAFLFQLQLAEKYQLPVDIHIREAFDETFSVLDAFGKGRVRGILHCFSGNVAQAHRAIDYGFLLGIGGVVTFKKATLADVVASVGVEHLVLETDAPYLAPVPHRGKKNESSYLPFIAEKIALLQGISAEEVARITSDNAKTLFGIA